MERRIALLWVYPHITTSYGPTLRRLWGSTATGAGRLASKKGAEVQALAPQSVADLMALRGLLESTALATVPARVDVAAPLVATLTTDLDQQPAARSADVRTPWRRTSTPRGSTSCSPAGHPPHPTRGG